MSTSENSNNDIAVHLECQSLEAADDLTPFLRARKSDESIGKIKKRSIKSFYRRQNKVIDQLEEAKNHLISFKAGINVADETGHREPLPVRMAILFSFIANIFLFAGNVFAAAISGSLAVLASAVDSALDLISGAVIFITHKIIERKNPERYPVGKTRYENLGIIVLAVLMGVASLQVIMESIKALIAGPSGHDTFSIAAIIVICTVIVLKSLLFIWCWRLSKISASCEVLAEDHRNDVLANIVALISFTLSSKYPSVWFLDPMFAIILAIYIISRWIQTGFHHSTLVAGRVADKTTVAQLIYFAANFDDRILFVDTVRAYHGGARLIVECDIVLAPETTLKTSHDIGEFLQKGLESFSDVERAFVHCDYEYLHSPLREHNPMHILP